MLNGGKIGNVPTLVKAQLERGGVITRFAEG